LRDVASKGFDAPGVAAVDRDTGVVAVDRDAGAAVVDRDTGVVAVDRDAGAAVVGREEDVAAVAGPRSIRRRSPAPSRIVIASVSTETSVAPGTISWPFATSRGPLGKWKSA
jgi:hypothetical protein